MTQPFWKTKTLGEMSNSEWESLCDGCGKCCCLRMEDEDTGAIYVTDIHCKLFVSQSCQCANYKTRKTFVPDCVQLKADKIKALGWIPHTCSYRLIAEGKNLFDWHHLISGSRQTIHDVGMSVQNQTYSELDIPEKEHIQHIVIWPGEPDITPNKNENEEN
ncbi:MAG: YcgN family cysteine cluster protein [Robiginitomaculum sp.]